MTRVRPATPADATAMRALHTAAVRKLGSTAYDADQVEAWAAPDADRDGFPFDDPGHYLVVATLDGGVVAGFGHIELTASMNAVGFYEHHDYEVVEETELDRSHRAEGVVLPVAVMEKPLP